MAVAPPRHPPILNLPNVLTLARLGLAVVLFACIGLEAWLTGLIVFITAAVTDWLDGYLARIQGLTSAFGRNLDPLVDKVLVCGAFIYLLPVKDAGLMPWMVTVVVGRELLVTGLRGYMETQGATFGADRFGKLKMGLQCAVLIGVLLTLAVEAARLVPELRPALDWANFVLLYAMIVATVLSGVQYVWKAVYWLRVA